MVAVETSYRTLEYQDLNALVLCFEDPDILWYHLLTPLEVKPVINHLVLFVLISKLDKNTKTERKTKRAIDRPVSLANGFSTWNCNNSVLALGSVYVI